MTRKGSPRFLVTELPSMCICGSPTLFGGQCGDCVRRGSQAKIKAARDVRRRLRRASVLFVIKTETKVCGVCLRPLTDETYPSPMSTTIGHEPPLLIAQRDGWLTVVQRPEHKRCNILKGTRTDSEIAGYAF